MKQDVVDKEVDDGVLVAKEGRRNLLLGGDRAHGVEQHEDTGESRGVVGVRHQVVPGQGEVAEVAELPLALDRHLLCRLWKSGKIIRDLKTIEVVNVSDGYERYMYSKYPPTFFGVS